MILNEHLSRDLTKYKSIPFWSWNDKLKETELRRQIQQMHSRGMGGFFMHARSGLMTEYMGNEWMSAIAVCINEAQKLGMNAWCYDENGWPSGFAGMKLLENPENWVHYLTCADKATFDCEALAVYVVENDKIKRVKDTYYNAGRYICVYDNTNSSVVDVLNPVVTHRFIKETHEKYYAQFKEAFGTVMLGFFTDEPQYFRWNTAYTPVILNAYKDLYGEDLLDTLGALFVDCTISSVLRFRYWRLMNKLFVENFVGEIYRWCNSHNCMLTGHMVEEQSLFHQMWCSAGAMPFYEYEHIPGMDWLGREIGTEIAPRQVSSVAMQLGKKQVLTETFGCAGWDVTPKELKWITEWQYVNGVNLMCQHLYPYSIRGQRKRDYPAFYSEHSVWTNTDQFISFNNYFTNLGYMLANSIEYAPVGVIHPMHSAYLTYNREKDDVSVKDLDEHFKKLVEKLGSNNIPHHYIDETLLEKYGTVKAGTLTMGQCNYTVIIIPEMQNLDSSTVKLLKIFVETGGKIWLAGKAPFLVDGIEVEKKELCFLKTNVTTEELKNKEIGIDKNDTSVRYTYRKSDFGRFIFAVNLSKTETITITYRINAKGAERFYPQTKEKKPLFYTQRTYGIDLPITFEPMESYVILLNENAIPCEKMVKPSNSLKKIDLSNADVKCASENALILDTASISFDHCFFEGPFPIMCISDRLLREQKNRTVFLKYGFEMNCKTEDIFLECENSNVSEVYFNGKKMFGARQGNLDKNFSRYNIADFVKIGINEIVLKINYFQSSYNYKMFNGFYYDNADITESVMNCISYETDIEAVYLLGNFSVIGTEDYSFAQNKEITVVSNKRFVISRSTSRINAESITTSGFPFFAGKITVCSKFLATGKENKFKLSDESRFNAAQVSFNGHCAKSLLFDSYVNISDDIKEGENTIELTLTSSNRNLYGPHHISRSNDPTWINPDMFTNYGLWNNGVCSKYIENYAFVNFGVQAEIL